MESLYGKDFADMQALLGVEDLKETLAELGDTSRDTQLKLELEGRDPDDGMNDIAYEKGRLLLVLIERTVGRERLDDFLKNYFKRHAFKTIATEEFIKEYKEQLATDPETQKKINIEEWIYKPGLPSNAPVIKSTRFEEVKKQVDAWQNGTPPSKLNVSGYSTDEWLRFLRFLPAKLSESQMKDLDDTFHFSTSGNSEILFAWLEHVIAGEYRKDYPAVKNFLINVGRRKFVKPLFAALIRTPDGKKFAQEIYAEARPNYHSVTRTTVDALLAD
jgi:hypothetical protein